MDEFKWILPLSVTYYNRTFIIRHANNMKNIQYNESLENDETMLYFKLVIWYIGLVHYIRYTTNLDAFYSLILFAHKFHIYNISYDCQEFFYFIFSGFHLVMSQMVR